MNLLYLSCIFILLLICTSEISRYSEGASPTSTLFSNSVDHMRFWLNDTSDYILDINSGDGAILINLLLSLGIGSDPNRNGIFIALEGNEDQFHALHSNLISSNLHNKGAIVSMFPKYSFLDLLEFDNYVPVICYSEPSLANSADCDRFSKHSIYYFHKAAIPNGKCPNIIILHQSSVGDSTFNYEALFSLAKLIDICRPTIYLHNIVGSDARVAIDFLLLHKYTFDNILWNVYASDSELSSIPDHLPLNVDLIAVGDLGSDMANKIELAITNGYVKVRPNKYYISEYPELFDLLTMHSSVFSVFSASCQDGGFPPCNTYVNLFCNWDSDDSVSIYHKESDDIFSTDEISSLQPFTIEVDVFHLIAMKGLLVATKSILSRLSLIVAAQPRLQYLTIDFNLKYSNAEINSISALHCNAWIEEFLFVLFPRNNIQGLFNFETKSFVRESSDIFFSITDLFGSLRQQCISWVGAQAFHRRRTLLHLFRIPSHAYNTDYNLWGNIDSLVNPLPPDHTSSLAIDSLQNKIFHPLVNTPFQLRRDTDLCFETIFCNHSFEFINRVNSWQNPQGELPKNQTGQDTLYMSKYIAKSQVGDKFTCKDVKFLVFQPMSAIHGIGSMLIQIATVLKIAIENDRILVLDHPRYEKDSLKRWALPGCETATFECIFQPLSNCILTDEELESAETTTNGKTLNKYFHRTQRVLRFAFSDREFESNSEWKGSTSIFDGLLLNQYRDTSIPGNEKIWDTFYNSKTRKQLHFSSFTSSIKIIWASSILRYVFRPREWFSRILQRVVAATLVGPDGVRVDYIPMPFQSLHVRYGTKRSEVDLVDLSKYMKAIEKNKYIKNIFVSTETQEVIEILRKFYPLYNFYHLHYERLEVITDVKDKVGNKEGYLSDELIYSMANLFVSVEADAFVGTLTSNWCQLINYLQRTRGDAGFDYLSVDTGSSFSTNYLE